MTDTLQMVQGKAIAEAFNKLNPIGTPVIKIDDLGNSIETKTRTEAWVLGHGQAVVSVEGAIGGYNLDRIISGAVVAQKITERERKYGWLHDALKIKFPEAILIIFTRFDRHQSDMFLPQLSEESEVAKLGIRMDVGTDIFVSVLIPIEEVVDVEGAVVPIDFSTDETRAKWLSKIVSSFADQLSD